MAKDKEWLKARGSILEFHYHSFVRRSYAGRDRK